MTEQPPARLPGAPRVIPPWLGPVVVAASLAAMVAWSFAQRWDVLSASPFPLGVDGYFYPVQLRSLLEAGELQYPASPLAFWLLAPFAAATDPITGAKLGAAVLGALIALPAYAVGAQLGRPRATTPEPHGDQHDDTSPAIHVARGALLGRPRATTGEREHHDHGRGPGLIAAAIAVSSSGSMYLTIEFVKNGIGLTVALTALWLVLRCFDAPTRGRIAAAVLGVIAAVLAHKMAAAIVVGIAIPAAWIEARGRGALRGRLAVIAAVAVAVAAAAALAIAGAISPQRFLSPADLAFVEALFTSEAEWTLPVLGKGRLLLSYEPLIATLIALGAAILLIVERRRRPAQLPTRARAGVDVAAWSIIGLALFIGLPWLDVASPQGLGMRLRVIAFVPLALCAAIVARTALPHVLRAGDPAQRFGACLALALLAIMLRVGGGPRTEGQVITHPALVTGAQALAGRIPDGDTAIVPERHIAFMVAWYARARISIRPEPVASERRWRVMPLAFIKRTSTQLDRVLLQIREHDLPRVIGLHPSHPNGLVLVPEQTWRAVLELLPDPERTRLTAWPTI